jgi:hypothetical protein
MSYKPHTANVPGGIVYYGDPAADAMLSAESTFAYDDSNDRLSVGKITTTSDVIVGGNLTVSGTTTVVNTETVTIADNKIELNSDYSGSSPSADAGLIVNRGTETDTEFLWDEGNNLWEFKYDTGNQYSVKEHVAGGTGISHSDSGYLRTLDLDISGLSVASTTASDSDVLIVDQGSGPEKITRGNLISGLGAGSVTSVSVTSDTLTVTNGTVTSSGTIDLEVNVDGTTITHDGSNQLKIVDGGVNTTQLADASVTEAKLSRTLDSSFTTADTISSDINLVTTGGSDLTVNLPTPVSGQIVTVKKIDSGSGNVIIGTTGSDTIDGAATKRLYYQYESLTCVAKTGSPNEWFII